MIQEEHIAEIVKQKGNIQTIYNEWNHNVIQLKKKSEKTVNKKKDSRPARKLISIKRRFKKEYNSTKEEDLINRRKLISRHIYDEQIRGQVSKIKRTIEIQRKNGGGMKEETFWEFRKRLIGKKEEPRIGMKDKEENVK